MKLRMLVVVALLTVQLRIPAPGGLAIALSVLGAYLVILGLGLRGRRLPLPTSLATWLHDAAVEEEAELEEGTLPLLMDEAKQNIGEAPDTAITKAIAAK